MKIEDGLPDNPLDEPAEVRVARGARLLDHAVPGWRARIDRDRLYMTSGVDCVAGQLFPITGYDGAMAVLQLWTNVQATRYGFHAWGTADNSAEAVIARLQALQPLWLAELDREPATT
jgi:hypothetical protein